jgi:hypothetical protein
VVDFDNYDVEQEPQESQSILKMTAYLLYDEIPTHQRIGAGQNDPYKKPFRVPICIICFEPNTPKDNVYLFFHKGVTSDDITITVKLLLGITPDTDFTLKPPIAILPTDKQIIKWETMKYNNQFKESLGNIFVKLIQCGTTYCIESGTFSSDIEELNKVKTTKHLIQGKTPSVLWRGKSIKDLLCKKSTNKDCNSDETFITKKILETKRTDSQDVGLLLPNLWSSYDKYYNKLLVNPNYKWEPVKPTVRPLMLTSPINVEYSEKITLSDIVKNIMFYNQNAYNVYS